MMEIYSKEPHELMKTMRSRIDAELESFFIQRSETRLDDICMDILSRIREFTLNGGKRLRPMLVVIGHDLFAPHDEKIFKAAISIELTQSYLLIHDDIMDQSETRRGKPSLHAGLREDIRSRVEDSARISQNLSIVAGDLAESYAHQSLLSSGMNPEVLLKANMELSRIIEMTGYGQIIDIDSAFNEGFGQRDLLRLHILKTAKYTIEGPLCMGAYLSGTSADLKPLSYYGILLGTAFQLHDDILGLYGDEKQTGKSIKSDVNEGKKTLLMLKAMELCDEPDRSFIKRCLQSGEVSDSDFRKLQGIVRDCGSYDYSRKMMAMMIRKSKEYLSMITGEPRILSFLAWFADYIVARES